MNPGVASELVLHRLWAARRPAALGRTQVLRLERTE